MRDDAKVAIVCLVCITLMVLGTVLTLAYAGTS